MVRQRLRRNGGVAAGGLLAVVAVLSLGLAPPRVVPTGDEADYFREAIHLARAGVFSSAPVEQLTPTPDAYREPGYSFLLACTWKLVGIAPPTQVPSVTADHLAAAVGAVRALGGFLLLVTAAAVAAAVGAAGGGRAAVVTAAAFVLASPALRQAALTAGSEGLAAVLVALSAAALAGHLAHPSRAQLLLAGLFVGLAPLARGALVVLIPLGLVLAWRAKSDDRRSARRRHLALFAFLALAPSGLWMLRNAVALGHPVLADRGGLILSIRAELDRQLGHEGLASALAAWTPSEAVRRWGERRWPEATWRRYAWQREGNFFTRAINRWHAERRAPADSLDVDRRLGREALGEFARHPLRHLVATIAVGWRGLFAEGSPAALVPLDLTLASGLFLALTLGSAWRRAQRERNAALLAVVAWPTALMLFHALATEFLPRFHVPSLPLLWGLAALLLLDRGGSRQSEA